MEPILANNVNVLNLGRQGENLRTKIVFDYSDLAQEFPGGAAILIHRMPDATDGHAVAGIAYDFDLDHLIWTVSESELAKEGQGECQLIYSWEGRAKSKIWKTNVGRSLVATGSQPPNWQDYIDQMADIAAEAVANFARAYQAYKDAETERIKAEGEVEKAKTEVENAKAEVEKAKEEAIRSKGFADDSEQSAEQAEKWKNESPTFWAQPDEPAGAKDNDLWWDTDDDLYGLLKNANVANNLTTTDEGYALDARQGKVLNDEKVNKRDIVNNLTSTAIGVPLSAYQGKVLGDWVGNFSESSGMVQSITGVNANALTKTGFYYISNCTGFPYSYGYCIVVARSEDRIKQFFSRNEISNDLHMRMKDGSTWTDWVKVPSVIDTLSSTSTADALSANKGKVLRDNLNYFSNSDGICRYESNKSLNDLSNTGMYVSGTWIASSAPENQTAGYCIVIASYNNQKTQIFFAFQGTGMWTRTQMGSWSEWAKIVTDADHPKSKRVNTTSSSMNAVINMNGENRHSGWLNITLNSGYHSMLYVAFKKDIRKQVEKIAGTDFTVNLLDNGDISLTLPTWSSATYTYNT